MVLYISATCSGGGEGGSFGQNLKGAEHSGSNKIKRIQASHFTQFVHNHPSRTLFPLKFIATW